MKRKVPHLYSAALPLCAQDGAQKGTRIQRLSLNEVRDDECNVGQELLQYE
jgi:hypothetical protein